MAVDKCIMKKNVLLSVFLFYNCGYSSETDKVDNTLLFNDTRNNTYAVTENKQWDYMQNDPIFVPDTTINRLLFLNNNTSIIKNLCDMKNLMIYDVDYFPYVYFVNRNKNQYIKMTIFAGGSFNTFDVFEIGYLSFIKNDIQNNSDFEYFYTESGICLGMTKAEVKKIKGNSFIETTSNGMTVITYRISENSDFDGENFTSKFLERNGIGYKAIYYFTNNKLVKFEYGFEYP
jgi:hypothetical protein